MCDQCSKEFPKKTDYDDHLAKYHKVGSLDLTCQYCGKEMSAKRSLNTHVRTIHKKSFKYPCPVLNCGWRTDAKGLHATHMEKKHGEEPSMEYGCDLCHKLFDGENLLKRHQKVAMCQVAKNFDCTQCAPSHRWFKLRERMIIHIKKYHTNELDRLTCAKCNKLFGDKSALSNHMVLHRGTEVLAKARRLREARDRKIASGKVPPKRKRGRPSKSAPPKIIPSASAEPKPAKGKGKGTTKPKGKGKK